MSIDAFGYEGKRALVVGGATGMGAAVASLLGELGGEVFVIDVADVDYEVSRVLRADLRDRASVDCALDQIGAPIHAVFSCAGVADGTDGLMSVNFVAQRHIIERLVAHDVLGPGSAVAIVSSVAGLGWYRYLPELRELLETSGWEAADAWVLANPDAVGYQFSKRAVDAYVAQSSLSLLRRGIRINGVAPGPTDTPLARAHAETWLGFGAAYNAAAGVDTLAPEQMAYSMAFLCSEAARGVTGTTLLVDNGQVGSALSGTFDTPSVLERMGVPAVPRPGLA